MKKTAAAKMITILLLGILLLNPLRAYTQEDVDPDINTKILREGMSNSQIMRTLYFFSDVYGPRLTGSPNLKNAGEWTVKQMRESATPTRDSTQPCVNCSASLTHASEE